MLTNEEKIKALELENRELREQLRKVAELAYFAYNGMKTSRDSDLERDVVKIYRDEY